MEMIKRQRLSQTGPYHTPGLADIFVIFTNAPLTDPIYNVTGLRAGVGMVHV